MMKKLVVCLALAVSGCVSTQEMPLAPNVVRIDTQSKGLLFTGQTVPATMRRAAQATLDRGYSHFKFADASLQQGSTVTGVVSNSSGSFNGNYGNGYMSGSSSGFGSSTVMRAPTAAASATVIMLRANDPDAKNAFDAEQILKQYAQ
jgi:hypothetical protein